MGVFSGNPYPCDLCLPGRHLADVSIGGVIPLDPGQTVYVHRVARLPVMPPPGVPPALLRPAGRHQPVAGEPVWVVLAPPPDQEENFRAGGIDAGVLNRAVVRLLYDDGTVLSDFADRGDALFAARSMCGAARRLRNPGREP